ncbi:MAG TPA: hypothetical protein VM029_00350 [Opitutaceae bacterium]|nr:hypothetical protein [Opitutaceae bacterium]
MKKLVLAFLLPVVLASLLRGADVSGLSSIAFTTSQVQFAPGDSITIQEVLATSSSLGPGNRIVLRGVYSLQSQAAALLAINLTSNEPPAGPSSPNARKQIAAGSGTFELEYPIYNNGALHITFYHTTTGAAFGGLYFASAPPGTPTTPPTPTPPTTTPPVVTPPVVSPPINTSRVSAAPFTTWRAQFDGGDSITIQEVLASSSEMQPGDVVLVRGQYTLQSRAQALLMISLTVNAPGAWEPVSPSSRREISAGSGTFELAYEIRQPGALHVTFYGTGSSGASFGGIYFKPPPGAGFQSEPGVALHNPVANTGKLANLSVRSVVGAGDGTLVAGLTVTEDERYVLIRGVGPSLAALGVTGTLRKPVLTVHKAGGELVATAGAWSAVFTGDRRTGIEMVARSVGAFPLVAGSDDAVLNLRLTPGGYTVSVSTGDGQSGVALLEVYTSSTFTLPSP